MNELSVLYDAPGPRARRRHRLCSVLFLLVLLGAGWWVLRGMAEKNQLAAEKWSPFADDPRVWTEFLLPGLAHTAQAASLALVLALPLGALLGIARLSDHALTRRCAGTVIDCCRAVPVLMLMLLANEVYARFSNVEPQQRPLYAVVSGLVVFNSAVLAEIVRAGILALPRGQSDAAHAIGMRKGQVMRSVLLPQAVTAMLPALTTQLVVIVKDTALGGEMLAFGELLQQVRLISANYGANTIASLTVVALLFVALNVLLTSLAVRIERHVRRGRKGTGAVVVNAAQTSTPT
ncbi:ABC transporter permease subunit [Streptomyces sp. NPDC050147]|uniref:amino acid ABC transporter permease n=1 Tax=Streptomyces sp. NPDC050147 TaxID=3155513 RepID=UPI003442D127